MTDAHVKVARRVKKKFLDSITVQKIFFAFTCVSGMAHNADDRSPPLGDGQRGVWGKPEWYTYKKKEIPKQKNQNTKEKRTRQTNLPKKRRTRTCHT